MRILLLNFAYGMGVDGSKISYVARAPLFFYATRSKCEELAEIVKRESPDMIGLVEIDGGSMRAGFVPQWKEVSDLGYSVFASSKYLPSSIWNKIPILRKHMNAVLYKNNFTQTQNEVFYFSVGMKRLVLRQTFDNNLDFYLVHLALDTETRTKQLEELAEIIIGRGSSYKVIVAGDFNTFKGRVELKEFLEKTKLKFGTPEAIQTFPAYTPKMELDFILASQNLDIRKYQVLPDIISDHRAIVLEI